jgi:hypothetical protein
MKIRAYITTRNREQMLTQVVEHLNSFGIIPLIKDDESNYDIKHPQTFTHRYRGKKGFWITWDEILKDCEKSEAELFVFMPDDFLNLDVERLIALHYEYTKKRAYAYNIINDGRAGQWTGIQEKVIDNETIMSGMVDCGFFCNREALNKIGYYINNPKRIGGSSGVGQQLSMRFLKERILMYKPIKSLATHGEHESIMHKEERKRNPLKSL